jgi:alkanesulfonate monooxygenase SsuD/methylene tetrahydromethanopterin reductase-like flavin-dependent oxidoreductase (luciferase family)
MTQTDIVHPWVAAGRQRIRFGILSTVLPDWSRTRDFAQLVEGLGFDSLWMADHPLSPLAANGVWPPLAALAEVTSSIRLGTLVSCIYYRHPVVLAREAADVDRISQGRLVLGLGSGDLPASSKALASGIRR